MPSVGKNVLRKDGKEKVLGTAKYLDDHALPGCLHGATLRSTIAYGRILKVELDPGFDWSEYVVATADDIPGDNKVLFIENDQPLLAKDRVMHPAEPIALVAHAERAKAYAALKHIRVEYEELEPVLSIEESLGKKQLLRGQDNLFKSFAIDKGDVEAGFAASAHIVEGTYRVPHQEQAYIEPNGAAAWFEDDGRLNILGSLQCPYYVHKAMRGLFGLADDEVRVVQAVTGGAFGGKEDYPNMICGHAALLALKARRPVKIVYDRAEDMRATTKRHPAVVRLKTGVSKDGRLLAQEIDIVMDGGAYMTVTPVVLSRGLLHSTGPYECPNVKARARAVVTNTPPNGAFRGFGAPQTLFPTELHWERISEAAGIDSLTLRRRNIWKVGTVTATGQKLRQSVGASEVLEKTLRRSRYLAKRKEFDRHNRRKDSPVWKGIGLALVHHGAGFTGSGEDRLASKAGLALSREGEVRVLVSTVDMGQGMLTTLSQIAADSLGLPYDRVRMEAQDTSKVPNSGPTVASRTCMIIGGLVRQAALELRAEVEREVGTFPKDEAGLRKAARRLCGTEPQRRFIRQYQAPAGIHFDDATYTGDAYGVFSYACAVVEVEVDKLTYEIRAKRFTSAQDVGKAIHPLIVKGQIMGGAAQGLGWALWENAVFERGVMRNARFTDYIIPTSSDAPPMAVDVVEDPYPHGPFGAKGIGELPMDVPAPAAAAAVRHATGLIIPDLPILPEKIAKALAEGSKA